MDGNFGFPTAPGRAIEGKLGAKKDVAGLNTFKLIVKLGMADLTKKNIASFAEKLRSKKPVESVQSSDENNPVCGGAPAIIVRQFCGVAV